MALVYLVKHRLLPKYRQALRDAERRLKVTARTLAIASPIMLLTAAAWYWQQSQARRFKDLAEDCARLAQSELLARQRSEEEERRAIDRSADGQ